MIGQKDFLEIINLLELNYEKKLDDKIIKIWYEEFKNYDKNIFYKCVVETIKNETFFPTINKVKEFGIKISDEYVDEAGFHYKNGRRVL